MIRYQVKAHDEEFFTEAPTKPAIDLVTKEAHATNAILHVT